MAKHDGGVRQYEILCEYCFEESEKENVASALLYDEEPLEITVLWRKK